MVFESGINSVTDSQIQQKVPPSCKVKRHHHHARAQHVTGPKKVEEVNDVTFLDLDVGCRKCKRNRSRGQAGCSSE
jgi:hypothetical protein